MTTWLNVRTILGVLLIETVVIGCSNIHEIGVGVESAEPDLGRCSEPETRCDTSSLDPIGVGQRVSQECTVEAESAWHIAWTRNLDDVPCPPLGKCRASQAVLADDGTTWFVAWPAPQQRAGELEGLQLGRYGARGEVLFETLIDSWRAPPPRRPETEIRDMAARPFPNIVTLAVNAQGHALVGYSGATLARDERSQRADPWLAEFDGNGKPIGGRVRLTGLEGDIMMLQSAPDGWLLTVTRREPVDPIVVLEPHTRARPMRTTKPSQPNSVPRVAAPGSRNSIAC